MGSLNTIVPPNGLVLVTGANGFIGSHIVLAMLSLNYRVRGTVRDGEKATTIRKAVASRFSAATFETVLVPDVSELNAYDNAVEDVDGSVHVAGAMSFGANPEVVISPMRAVTKLR